MAFLESYQTLVFDCDGVILDSNMVKTNAFSETVLPYGDDVADALVDYHIRNGGVSRFKKFEWFIDRFGDRINDEATLGSLVEQFADRVRSGLLTCPVSGGLEQLRERTRTARWMVVSGGDEEELRGVFKARGLEHLFEGGIYGSPATKEEILDRLISRGGLLKPALFLGDSKYDFKAARSRDLDFVFLRGWSEVTDIQEFLSRYDLNSAEDLAEIAATV